MSEEDISFLMSIQDLEQPDFDNACLERENKRLRSELQLKDNRINMALDYIRKAEGNDMNYVATLLLGYPIEISEMREQVLTVIGSDRK